MKPSRLLAPLAFRSLLRDFTLVTYAVPAVRVRERLPRDEGIELQTFRDDEGKEQAFVSSGYFMNERFRWRGLPWPSIGFAQSTYRAYVLYRGRPAVWFFGVYLGSKAAFALQGAFARHAYEARFEPAVVRDARDGIETIACRILHKRHGASFFKARVVGRGEPRPPFSTIEEMSRFLTYRLHGLFESPVGTIADQVVRHRHLYPLTAELLDARFAYWEEVGILFRDEAKKPYSVLIEPAVEFELFPPVPAHLVPELRAVRRRIDLEHQAHLGGRP